LPREIVVLVGNTAWSIFNFRLGLIKTLISIGKRVLIFAPEDQVFRANLESLGCEFVPLPIDSAGTSLIRDAGLFIRMVIAFAKLRPACVILYTIKPVIYGALASGCMGIRSISVITGLGAVFGRKSILTWFVERLYRIALPQCSMVFFLNNDDREHFQTNGLLDRTRNHEVLPSEGVDIEHFSKKNAQNNARNLISSPEKNKSHDDNKDETFTFLLVSRLLGEKGIREYVAAAKYLKKSGINAKFKILGFLGVQNPSAISSSEMDSWIAEGIIDYLGTSADVRPYLLGADCVVLPSYYREGIPRALLEAASMELPIVTTDWVGCREVVEDGITGFLCRPRDSVDLSRAMLKVCSLSTVERAEMGRRGRDRVAEKFDERIVIARYLPLI
jgi:glycosyltransferase involved in cell wall biosynthesis